MVQETKSKDENSPPPRRNRTDAVAYGARNVASDIFSRAGFRDPTLVLRWPDIVGADVARLCQPLKLSDGNTAGVLTLKAEPGATLFLQHESRAICQHINAWFGREAIVRLRFVQGPIATRPRRQIQRSSAVEPASEDPSLRYRGPEPVREALIKLARRRAARQQPD